MASALYDSYKVDCMDGSSPNLSTAMDVIFVEDGYTFNPAHDFFDDLTNTQGDGGAARTNAESLAGLDISSSGVFDANDSVFASVTGTNIDAFVLFIDSGSDATSALIAYVDNIQPSQISPSAQEVTLIFDSAGIFFF